MHSVQNQSVSIKTEDPIGFSVQDPTRAFFNYMKFIKSNRNRNVTSWLKKFIQDGFLFLKYLNICLQSQEYKQNCATT